MQLVPSTVLLVSANYVNTLGLHALLVEQSNLHLLDDVQQADMAVRIAAHHHPDQIVVDSDVGGMEIVPLVRALQRASPDSRIVVMGRKDALRRETLLQLTELGVRGYLLWSRLSRDAVVLSLALVMVDDLLVGHRAVLDELLAGPERRRRPRGDQPVLTDDERTVLTLLTDGLSEKEIARETHTSEATTRRAVALLRHKFGVTSTYALCAQAGRLGFVS